MIKISEEGVFKVQDRTKAKPLVPNSQVINAKEKFLKESKNVTQVNTQIIRKQNSQVAVMENVLVVWFDQTDQNITLN